MTQLFRKLIRTISLIIVVLFPILGIYHAILKDLPVEYIGNLGKLSGDMLQVYPLSPINGYMSWLFIILDKTIGSFNAEKSLIREILSYFSGSYWNITIGGITIADPLAFLQNLTSGQPISTSLAIAAAIPIVIALVLGRFFCAWICPVSTLTDITRFVAEKLRLPKIQKEVVTNQYLKICLLALGLILPFIGLTLFPYILPYVIMGRFFYSLALGKVLWSAFGVITLLVVIDVLVQRGFWCNYLCPTGLLLGILGKRRLITIKHNNEMCKEGCFVCKNSCAWQADPKVKYSLNCTNCGECIEKCPTRALGWLKPDPSDFEI